MVDIVMDSKMEWHVFDRAGAPSMWDDYETAPLFTGKSQGECEDWCEERGIAFKDIRYRKLVATVPVKFFDDLEKKADKARERIVGLGFRVVSDVTYRASAAWKDEPVHYAYIGDFGGTARLVGKGLGEAKEEARFDEAQGWLRELFGMSEAVHELGFTLTFGADGKHRIYNRAEQWVTIEMED